MTVWILKKIIVNEGEDIIRVFSNHLSASLLRDKLNSESTDKREFYIEEEYEVQE